MATEIKPLGHVLCGCARHGTRWRCKRLPEGVLGKPGESKCKAAVSWTDQADYKLWSNYRVDVDGAPCSEEEFRKALGCPPAPQPQSVRESLVSRKATSVASMNSEKPWRGTADKKPWQYRVTAVIPHRNTSEHLELCVQFLWQQTERPYLMVIDTGSDDAALQRVLALRSEAVEVHQIACHGTEDYADVVCYAMDLAMSACRTEYLWCVHSDCFVINRTLLAELLEESEGGKHPVLGYESVSANTHPECKGMVSHTCTLLHMPTMDRLDVTWSKRRLRNRCPVGATDIIADVEMALNYRLRERCITPLLLGSELESGIERDANRVHLRSATLGADLLAAQPGATNGKEDTLAELHPMAAAGAGPGSVRNLIYHIAPFSKGGVWRKNVAQLMRRIDLFNGKRVVAIAVGDGLDSPETVDEAFAGKVDKFIEVPNCRTLRERASFIQLMEAVESTDSREATFYAHAKGVATSGDAIGVMYWRNLMYSALLDDPQSVRSALDVFPVIGTHRKRVHVVYPDGVASSPWHFAGTFFWFRNDAVFSRSWRDALPHSGWGVEAWPGRMFSYEESCCLAMDEPFNPYDPAEYNNGISDDDGPGETSALKLEIGGGHKPRGDGFINIDLCETADIRLDLDAPDLRLPFDDCTVMSVYSSHCFEHLRNLRNVLHEIARVCQIGAYIEIRVPHWLSNMANCHGHVQTISHEQVDHWSESAIPYWWDGSPRRLKLYSTEYVPGGAFAEWKQILPHATDEQIKRLCPDACHETKYIFHVVSTQ